MKAAHRSPTLGRAKPRILVVDDDEPFALVLGRALQKLGYAVEVVPNGSTAVARARAWPASLVVTDINMPDMDGIEVMKALRADPAIPVIAMSGRGAVPAALLLDTARLMGAVAVLAKPFDLRDLVSAIRETLGAEPDPGSDAH